MAKKRVRLHDIREEEANSSPGSTWHLANEIGYQGLFRLGWARAVAANNNKEILVADHTASQVKIYNKNGHNVDMIHSKDHIPIGVVSAPDGRVFIASFERIKVFFRHKDQILPWQKMFEFTPSVTCHGVNEHPEIVSMVLSEDRRKLLVGTRFPEFITAYDIKDGSPYGEDPSIPIHICPSYIAEGPNGQIIVSSYGAEDEVHIIDTNGRVLFKLDPPEGLDSWVPSGVCYNKADVSEEGSYYIANWLMTGRGIYCYSVTGVYQGVVTKVVYNPQGLCMADNNQTLLVADDKSVKIFERNDR